MGAGAGAKACKPATSSFVTLKERGGATISYSVRPAASGHAAKAPLILIHGFLDSLAVWDDYLAALPRTRRIVRISLRGFGESSKDGPFTSDAYADDVVALMDALSIPEAVLCGHSMGTIISTAVYARAPKRVCGLVLCGAAAHANSLKGAWPEVELFKGCSPGDFSKEQRDALCEFQEGASPDSKVMAETFKASPEAICGAWESLCEGDNHTAELATIESRVLIVWGTKDEIFPADVQAELKAALLAVEPTVVEIPGAAHSGMLTGHHAKQCAAFTDAWLCAA